MIKNSAWFNGSSLTMRAPAPPLSLPGLPGACNWKMPNSALRKEIFGFYYRNFQTLFKKTNYLINSKKFKFQFKKRAKFTFLASKRPNLATLLGVPAGRARVRGGIRGRLRGVWTRGAGAPKVPATPQGIPRLGPRHGQMGIPGQQVRFDASSPFSTDCYGYYNFIISFLIFVMIILIYYFF